MFFIEVILNNVKVFLRLQKQSAFKGIASPLIRARNDRPVLRRFILKDFSLEDTLPLPFEQLPHSDLSIDSVPPIYGHCPVQQLQ